MKARNSLSLSPQSLLATSYISSLQQSKMHHISYGFDFSINTTFFLSILLNYFLLQKVGKCKIGIEEQQCALPSFLTPQIILSQHHSLTPLLAAHQILISQVTFVSCAGTCFTVDIPAPNFPPDGPFLPPSVSH